MTVAITTLRSTVAAALSNPTVWDVFSFPPSTILANSVVVAPANLKIIMTVPMFDNASNLIGIEETIVAVFNKLAASSIVFNITAVSAPSVLTVASGDMLTADFQISVLTSWS